MRTIAERIKEAATNCQDGALATEAERFACLLSTLLPESAALSSAQDLLLGLVEMIAHETRGGGD